jgi:ABC-type multidrug transport system fused ATPase/permease subunit
MILDYRAFSEHFDLIIYSMGIHTFNIKNKFKKILFIIFSLDLLLVIAIIISLILFVTVFFVLVFYIMKNINDKLEEKFNETSIKEILIKKLYNLKLLLSFYDNDINIPINDLNNIYNDYRDNFNTKVKEEMKMYKKEGKNINEKKNKNCIEIFKVIKKYEIFKNSGRRNTYFYSLMFIIIASLVVFIFILLRWIVFFKMMI